jgi:glycosyltransferase involved in cell wall biosynthesis
MSSDARNDGLRVLLACDKLGYGDERLHGIGRLVVDWTRGLSRAGVDVTSVVLRRPGPLAKRLAEESLPFVYLKRSFFDPRTITDLVRLIRDRRIQVVHLQNYGATAVGRLAARWCGIPAIVHIHANLLERPGDYPTWLHGMDLLLRSSTASCLAVSDSAARSAIEVQGFPAQSVRVLPNAIDLERFHPPDPATYEAARRSLGILDGDPVALCVGRLFRVKGVDQLLEAWSLVKRRVPHGWLVIAGDGPERAELEARAEQLGAGGRLRFLGHRADVETVFKACDLLVVPSRSETGPLTAVEAMATGLPVVAFRVGGVGEFVRDGEQGILLSPGDVEGLADGMVRIMTDSSLRRRLGDAALAHSKKFGIERSIEGLVEEYRRVLGSKGTP